RVLFRSLLRDRARLGGTGRLDRVRLCPAPLRHGARLRLRVDLERAGLVLRLRQRGLRGLLALVPLRIRAPLRLVLLGIGGLADLRDELALAPLVLLIRDLLRLREDALLLLAPRQLLRSLRRGALNGRLPLDLRVAQIERLLRLRHLLTVAVLRLRRLAHRLRLRDAGLLRDERG